MKNYRVWKTKTEFVDVMAACPSHAIIQVLGYMGYYWRIEYAPDPEVTTCKDMEVEELPFSEEPDSKEGMSLEEEQALFYKEYNDLSDEERQRLIEESDRKYEELEAEYKSARSLDSVTLRFDADGHVTGWKEN